MKLTNYGAGMVYVSGVQLAPNASISMQIGDSSDDAKFLDAPKLSINCSSVMHKVESCDFCNGSGKIKVHECMICEGSGYVRVGGGRPCRFIG